VLLPCPVHHAMLCPTRDNTRRGARLCLVAYNVYAYMYLPGSLRSPCHRPTTPHPPHARALSLSLSLSHTLTHTLPRGSSLPPLAVPGFPVSTVSGHAGSMILGTLSGYVLTTCRSPPVVRMPFTPPVWVCGCVGMFGSDAQHPTTPTTWLAAVWLAAEGWGCRSARLRPR
jgi:hypothetical protein